MFFIFNALHFKHDDMIRRIFEIYYIKMVQIFRNFTNTWKKFAKFTNVILKCSFINILKDQTQKLSVKWKYKIFAYHFQHLSAFIEPENFLIWLFKHFVYFQTKQNF